MMVLRVGSQSLHEGKGLFWEGKRSQQFCGYKMYQKVPAYLYSNSNTKTLYQSWLPKKCRHYQPIACMIHCDCHNYLVIRLIMVRIHWSVNKMVYYVTVNTISYRESAKSWHLDTASHESVQSRGMVSKPQYPPPMAPAMLAMVSVSPPRLMANGISSSKDFPAWHRKA